MRLKNCEITLSDFNSENLSKKNQTLTLCGKAIFQTKLKLTWLNSFYNYGFKYQLISKVIKHFRLFQRLMSQYSVQTHNTNVLHKSGPRDVYKAERDKST